MQAPMTNPAMVPPGTGRQPAPGVRAQTLAWQRLVNWIVRGLLRTPLVCRLAGSG